MIKDVVIEFNKVKITFENGKVIFLETEVANELKHYLNELL